LVGEIALAKPNPVRPRRGSQAAHLVINHIKGILDVKIRVACHQLDDINNNIDKLAPDALEKLGTILTKIKVRELGWFCGL